MNKRQFLNTLKEALLNGMSISQADAQIRYYSEYIEDQIKQGYTEQQVLDELGDPRSIAHNLIDAVENTGTYEYVAEDSEVQKGTPRASKWKSYVILLGILCAVFVVLILVTRLIIWALPSICLIAAIFWILKKINR